jgi:pantetheine-phosphate adenylyltransferase
MVIAVFPATFDPITNGHVDIAERAAALFDEVIVAVYDHGHPIKDPLFSTEERVRMVSDAVAHLDNVRVHTYAGLTVEYARLQGAQVVIRGLRVVSDIETISLMASPEHAFLSSSLVKEVALLGGDVTDLVPPTVAAALQAKAAARVSHRSGAASAS